MKKSKFRLLLCIFSMLLLIGCGKGDSVNSDVTAEEDSITENTISASEEKIASAEELFTSELLLEENWRDNTLDHYMAVILTSLLPDQSVSELGGGKEFALADTYGAVFKKHLFSSAESCWDELKTINKQGEENSVRLAFRENAINQAWGMGSILGTDNLMMWDMEKSETGSGWRYRFFTIDKEQQIIQTIYMDFLDPDGQEAPNHIMVDHSGNIHFITAYMGYASEDNPAGDRNYYCITDSEGNLLAKYDYSGIHTRLVALYDGRVAIWSQLVNDQGILTGSRLEYVDAETGKATILAEFGQDAPKPFINGNYYTLWNETTLLFADSQGLHLADLSGDTTEDVYIWSSHGIRFYQMEELQIQEDGDINLIYIDSQGNGNLLCLKPAEEQEEILELVFAVSSYMKKIYEPSVVEFNKRYPVYHIVLKSDYEETALMTELIAGNGPVLVDTQLTGFDNHRELWTPLEGLFSKPEWQDTLIPKAMEQGEIDGTLYGVVSSFKLKTVIIGEDEPTEWTYETFLEEIEDNTSIQAIFNGQNDIWSFVATFMIHGLEDNYLIDAESGTTSFSSDEFRKLLRLGMTYCNGKDNIEPGASLLDGEVFCNTIDIQRPEQIDLYRIIYGEDINYIGYPTRNGSSHYIVSDSPLAIRDTASDEEKIVAGTFLQMLLSEEGQTEAAQDPNFGLSVRWDILEEQISQINEETCAMAYGYPQITLEDQYDREYDADILYNLLEKAQPGKDFPKELNYILMEELDAYSNGMITEDDLIERLTKRVELYLAEQYGK